jgi:hypothetical protein
MNVKQRFPTTEVLLQSQGGSLGFIVDRVKLKRGFLEHFSFPLSVHPATAL